MKGWFIFLVLALIAGYLYYFQPQFLKMISGKLTSILASTVVKCEPNWMLVGEVPISPDYCKTACYKGFSVTSYRLADWVTREIVKKPEPTGIYYCYCDANNCNPTD